MLRERDDRHPGSRDGSLAATGDTAVDEAPQPVWEIRYTRQPAERPVPPRHTFEQRAGTRAEAVAAAWREWMTRRRDSLIVEVHMRRLPDGAWQCVEPAMACGQGTC